MRCRGPMTVAVLYDSRSPILGEGQKPRSQLCWDGRRVALRWFTCQRGELFWPTCSPLSLFCSEMEPGMEQSSTQGGETGEGWTSFSSSVPWGPIGWVPNCSMTNLPISISAVNMDKRGYLHKRLSSSR